MNDLVDAVVWIVIIAGAYLIIAVWREQRALRCPPPPRPDDDDDQVA